MAALGTRAKAQRAPAWLWAVSWTFWFASLAAVVAFGVHKIQARAERLLIEDATWRMQFALCKRISVAPRPSWRECQSRMEEPRRNLMAPARPAVDPAAPRAG